MVIAPKISDTCLEYWRRLLPNFTPIGKVLAEKTVTKQKTINNIQPILRTEG